MDVPRGWKTETDAPPEKLIFAFEFHKKQLDDFMALRAEQLLLSQVFRAALLRPQEAADLTADSWAQVIRGPVTPELMGQSIFTARTKLAGGLQGKGGKVVKEQDDSGVREREDTLVDAKVVPLAAAPGGGPTDALLFHVRTVVLKPPGQGQDEDSPPAPARFWSAKALLRNGTVTVGYITATEAHWQPDFGQFGGDDLESVVNSLRLLPPAAAKPA